MKITSGPHDFLTVNQLNPAQGGSQEIASIILQWQNFITNNSDEFVCPPLNFTSFFITAFLWAVFDLISFT